MLITIIISLIIVALLAVAFYRHQILLRDRAMMFREAIRNRAFNFRLPSGGLFFGERALQDTLNALEQDINRLVAQNEVESWQRLTRVLTHEIMNATTPIQSISQAYLANPDVKGTPYEEGIRAIHDTSARLAAFVQSFRKQTQLQEPAPTDLPLLQFVASVKALYPDMEWRIDVPQEVEVHADEHLLRQVFINLVKNAVEARATIVSVVWRNAIIVSNNGAPITPDVRREIFVPFFSTKSGGSGIGLSLSRQIMMMQGMTLSLADTPEAGYHVTFVIERPLGP